VARADRRAHRQPFKPYVYGATRNKAARAAPAQAEAEHGKRPSRLRGLRKAEELEPASTVATG